MYYGECENRELRKKPQLLQPKPVAVETVDPNITRPKPKIFSFERFSIDQFRYIKIQSKTKGIISRLWGINSYSPYIYSPEPRDDVFCLGLNFNISKLVD